MPHPAMRTGRRSIDQLGYQRGKIKREGQQDRPDPGGSGAPIAEPTADTTTTSKRGGDTDSPSAAARGSTSEGKSMFWKLAMFAFMAGIVAADALAQAPPASFEVATVRASGPDSAPMSLQRQPGGRLITSNTPLTFLISWAFGLDDGRLVGAPKGADSIRFDIVAKAPTDSPPPGQMQLMMRSLLAERFGLVVHTEKRNRNAYTLRVAEGGTKVTI